MDSPVQMQMMVYMYVLSMPYAPLTLDARNLAVKQSLVMLLFLQTGVGPCLF
jgi:hypothetical protein